MKIINLLDEKTINKIAAGEVVERPLSIVKELVENSIDSGATEITIEVKKDPLRYIRISDNGSGILKEDVLNAFMRHATSKIKTIDDIETIMSLGFRGEALSSISAISKVEMLTKVQSEDIGQKVLVEGGKVVYKEDAGCPNGTIITVRDIFFNTPARLKFLKSSSRELSVISDIVEKIALSNTNISFRYKIDDKLVFLTPGKGNLKDVIRTIYGKSIYSNIIEINEEDEDLKISGYIGNTNITKGNRSNEIIFINGRVVKSPIVSSAVEKAYKSMLPINKFPFFILSIYINPKFIDVNVHPSKAEIKFQDDGLIFKKVYKCIKQCILNDFDIKDAFEEEKYKENVNYIQESISYEEVKTNDTVVNEKVETLKENIEKETKEYTNKSSEEEKTPLFQTKTVDLEPQKVEVAKKEEKTFVREEICSQPYIENKVKNKEDKIPDLRILGQINSTYIIAEGNKEMFIIDQHAAHERIYYEKYMKEFKDFSIRSQPLIVPIVKEFSLSEKQLILDNIESFKKIGFKIEDFGGVDISIREVPLLYGNPDTNELFNEILEDVLDTKEKKITSCIDKIIYSMACRSAVKAGDNLYNEEIEKLIESLKKCESPFTCPHGRPTIIKMSCTELEKKFKRIQ